VSGLNRNECPDYTGLGVRFAPEYAISCGDAPKFQQLNQSDTILAFGDSLTAGVGTTPNKAYPAILQNLTGVNVVNAGVSGETTSEGLKRFQQEIDRHTPQLIILLEGGNDILRRQPVSQTKDNLAQMIEVATNKGIDILFVGVPEKSLFSTSAPLYEELAAQYDVIFDGEIISELLKSPKYKSDPIHFNAEGYQALAKHLYEILRDEGAISE
jgi:lysophospholipase L1-like esterase